MADEQRKSPHVNLTLSPAVVDALDELVAEDAAEAGADPRRYRSTTVSALVMAERKRRAERAARKKS